MSDKMTKQVTLTQVVEDLRSGLSRWKKDDIGFGSLEKKYNLTLQEAIQLFAHPKIKDVESRIPTFVIVDDLPDTEPEVEAPVTLETKLEVELQQPIHQPVQQTRVVVKKPVEQYEEEPVLAPFI
jgi:hypothetical protein